jgi:hypothetical protein
VTHSESEIRMLEADARYARERASLYRARAWGGKRAANAVRLRQLEHIAESASARLRRARESASG